MAPISLKTFVDGLEALSITGVTRRYIHGPPAGMTNVPDLPAMFIAFPQISAAGKLVFGQQGGTGQLQAQLTILVVPVSQDYQARNFDRAVEMVDSLETAMIEVNCTIGGVLGWGMRVTVIEVAGHAYWAVIADVTGGRW